MLLNEYKLFIRTSYVCLGVYVFHIVADIVGRQY